MARCFVACFLKPASARALIECRPPVAGTRPVPLEYLHVTLLFAGQLEPADAEELAARCGELEAPQHGQPLCVTVKRLGGFPRGPRARMLAVELEPDAQLAAWHAQLRELWPAAASEQAFRPHVTLARSRRPQLMPEADCPSKTLTLNAPRLYESLTLADGARYRPWHTETPR